MVIQGITKRDFYGGDNVSNVSIKRRVQGHMGRILSEYPSEKAAAQSARISLNRVGENQFHRKILALKIAGEYRHFCALKRDARQPRGVTWGAVGESVKKNTVQHLEIIRKSM